jgi:hypothetical protein
MTFKHVLEKWPEYWLKWIIQHHDLTQIPATKGQKSPQKTLQTVGKEQLGVSKCVWNSLHLEGTLSHPLNLLNTKSSLSVCRHFLNMIIFS